MIVEGIPDDAPDLAASTRIALFDMAVPALPLRLDNAPDEKEVAEAVLVNLELAAGSPESIETIRRPLLETAEKAQ